MNAIHLLVLCILVPFATSAELAVTVSPPITGGSKAVVRLHLKNQFRDQIESARAAVFLLDEEGKVAAQGTKWVIGDARGGNTLAPGRETNYNFVVQAVKPFTTTNLTAKVSFSRVVLKGGHAVDPSKNVLLNSEAKEN